MCVYVYMCMCVCIYVCVLVCVCCQAQFRRLLLDAFILPDMSTAALDSSGRGIVEVHHQSPLSLAVLSFLRCWRIEGQVSDVVSAQARSGAGPHPTVCVYISPHIHTHPHTQIHTHSYIVPSSWMDVVRCSEATRHSVCGNLVCVCVCVCMCIHVCVNGGV